MIVNVRLNETNSEDAVIHGQLRIVGANIFFAAPSKCFIFP